MATAAAGLLDRFTRERVRDISSRKRVSPRISARMRVEFAGFREPLSIGGATLIEPRMLERAHVE